MRPQNLEEFVGQEHLLGPDRVFRRSLEAGQLTSMILWGPPGSGKTTLARLVAQLAGAIFVPISAVTAGVADLRRIVEEAKGLRSLHGRRTVLFIDEIHRFNRAQQDAILPHVEAGTICLVGATTENPSFEVISALLSRCRVFTLRALTEEEVALIVRRAIEDPDRGLGPLKVVLTDEAASFLCSAAFGDARVAINALEMAASAVGPGPRGERLIERAHIEDALQRRALLYDKAGDQHYDVISAYIKSLRGSDADAALYWLARMLEAGEDPLFIARRMVILAAEDIGLADPQALVVAVAAQQAVHFVGMPEGFLPLSEATIYLAKAPKSNSALTAYRAALEDVRSHGNQPVPLRLRNAVTGLMRELGYGKGYKYSHDYSPEDGQQDYLPEALKGRRYYSPGARGWEARLAEPSEESQS